MGRSRQVCIYLVFWRRQVATDACSVEAKHRGFGFVTFSSAGDAQDAIDNMDMNELQGKILKVNIARPMKAQPQLQGPADEPRIKCEFGRMFSGIGSGVRGIGAPSPFPGGAQVSHSNTNLARRDDETPHEHAPEPPAKPAARGKRRKAKDDEGKGDDDSNGRSTPVGRAKRAKAHAHHHHHQYVQIPTPLDFLIERQHGEFTVVGSCSRSTGPKQLWRGD